MRTPHLYVLVGVPCSGKSTWRENWMNKTEEPTIVVSTDDALEQIAEDSMETYEWAFINKFDEAKEIAYNNAKYAVEKGYDIIWDQTNMTMKARRRALSMVNKTYEKHCVSFNIPLPVILERLKKRNAETDKKVPIEVIERMLSFRLEPTLDEGFDTITKITS